MLDSVFPHSYPYFVRSVRAKARFVLEDAAKAFLEAVGTTAQNRLKVLQKDEILFRAQPGGAEVTFPGPKGEELKIIGDPHIEERMVPKAEFVGDGRVNPIGIPCLYLADSHSAVIAEMRPSIGAFITIGQFRTVRGLKLVNCSGSTTPGWAKYSFNLVADAGEPDFALKEETVWGDIGFAFSKPIARADKHIDYVPTQILAEALRDRGYDGIVYKSCLDKDGNNIALFDPTAATIISRCLYRTCAVSFECIRMDRTGEYLGQAQPTWPWDITSRHEERGFLFNPPFDSDSPT